MDKISFRKNAMSVRASLFNDKEEKNKADGKIFEHFKKFLSGRNIRNVLTYVSFSSEADTERIIRYLLSSGINTAVPRCRRGGEMDFYFIKDLSELRVSSMGIMEPEHSDERLLRNFEDALCIVPGVAFDRHGMRTGYGGGYYDRFLAAEKNVLAVGICYSRLVFDKVPSEQHDMSVSHIITEKGIIEVNG